jgi:hypothetical protein
MQGQPICPLCLETIPAATLSRFSSVLLHRACAERLVADSADPTPPRSVDAAREAA